MVQGPMETKGLRAKPASEGGGNPLTCNELALVERDSVALVACGGLLAKE